MIANYQDNMSMKRLNHTFTGLQEYTYYLLIFLIYRVYRSILLSHF